MINSMMESYLQESCEDASSLSPPHLSVCYLQIQAKPSYLALDVKLKLKLGLALSLWVSQ